MTPVLRRVAGALALALAATALYGCTADPVATPTQTPSASVSATRTPTPTPTPTPTTTLSPLTGVEVPKAEVAGPSLAAKIDNHWDARPQWGLDRTDLVYEQLVEGGITRYVAVWFSDVPEEIGPIRSIRPMDPDIISPLGGIVAYSGGQARFVQMMQNAPVHNAIHGGKDDRFMFRSREKIAPHNVVVRAQELRAAYASIDPPATQFSFTTLPGAASAAAYGSPSSGFDLAFSPSSARAWRWDAGTGAYLRSQDGRPDTAASGARLSATNVVVMSVAIDWSYGIVPRTVMVGSGKGWVATGGKMLEVTWSKESRDERIVLTNEHGVEVRLAPGNTWVELVPQSGSVRVVS